MERKSLKFPRLNLRRSGILDLRVVAVYDANDSRRALLQDKFEAGQEGQPHPALLGVTRYLTRDDTRAVHHIWATFAKLPDFPNEFAARVDYRQRSPDDLPIKSMGTREQTFLDVLQSMGESRYAQASATIDLGDREPGELWFPLPATLAGRSPEATLELTGVRGARVGVDEGAPEYTFSLDRSSDERVILAAEWTLQESLTPETLRTILARAASIGRDFVIDS